jgi:DNA-binding protein
LIILLPLFELPSQEVFNEIIFPIIGAIIIAILTGIFYFSRRRISNWWFGRKINPKLKQACDIYQKFILPEYVTVKPKIEVIEEKSEMPAHIPFGYIFIPKGQEELIWDTLIAYLPINCSLKRIRVLFDQSLRESLFDVLSYQLGMKLGKDEVAVVFRDLSLAKHKDDYEAMEKIYSDGKLTTIVLLEASIRFKKTGGNITTSDVDEFSGLVRKIAQINAIVVRVGKQNPTYCCEEIFKTGRNVILLARGTNISGAVMVANELNKKGYELYSQDELELSNPEIGTWHFEGENKREVSFMRIWLKSKETTNGKS